MPSRIERATDRLLSELGRNVVAVALFGSRARGELGVRSDADFFVVLRGIPRTLERRHRVYRPLYEGLNRGESRIIDVTVIDADESMLEDENLLVTPFLLNIASEARILWDRNGKLARFIGRIRKLIEEAGLERYRTREGKYGWKPRGKYVPAEA